MIFGNRELNHKLPHAKIKKARSLGVVWRIAVVVCSPNAGVSIVQIHISVHASMRGRPGNFCTRFPFPNNLGTVLLVIVVICIVRQRRIQDDGRDEEQ